jgi:hypothetical protein
VTPDLFEVAYRLSQVPTWLGWVNLTSGLCALSFLAGMRVR